MAVAWHGGNSPTSQDPGQGACQIFDNTDCVLPASSGLRHERSRASHHKNSRPRTTRTSATCVREIIVTPRHQTKIRGDLFRNSKRQTLQHSRKVHEARMCLRASQRLGCRHRASAAAWACKCHRLHHAGLRVAIVKVGLSPHVTMSATISPRCGSGGGLVYLPVNADFEEAGSRNEPEQSPQRSPRRQDLHCRLFDHRFHPRHPANPLNERCVGDRSGSSGALSLTMPTTAARCWSAVATVFLVGQGGSHHGDRPAERLSRRSPPEKCL